MNPAPLAQFTFADMYVGQTAEFSVHITEQMVTDFCTLSGDANPLHMDEVYAGTTKFKGRVVHGQLGASFFSQLVGMHLPGLRALYLKQTTSFHAPMRIGMHIVVRGTVTQIVEATHTIVLSTQIIEKNTGALLIDGTALVGIVNPTP